MALDAGGVVKLIGQLKKLPGPQFTTGGDLFRFTI